MALSIVAGFLAIRHSDEPRRNGLLSIGVELSFIISFPSHGSLSHAPFVCCNHEALWLNVSVNKDPRAVRAEAVPELQPHRSVTALLAGSTFVKAACVFLVSVALSDGRGYSCDAPHWGEDCRPVLYTSGQAGPRKCVYLHIRNTNLCVDIVPLCMKHIFSRIFRVLNMNECFDCLVPSSNVFFNKKFHKNSST